MDLAWWDIYWYSYHSYHSYCRIVYTSYFAKQKFIIDNGYVPLSISRITPHWYNGLVLELFDLVPPSWLLFRYKSNQISDQEYTDLYVKHVLDSLDPIEVYGEIQHEYGDKVTLLCYEKPGVFCHRHIVADWLSISTGFIIPELNTQQE